MSEEDIRAIAAEASGQKTEQDPLTQSVLRAAREMTQAYAASDDTFAVLKSYLDHESLTDLVFMISFYNAVLRFLETMQTDSEPEYQAVLADFPFDPD